MGKTVACIIARTTSTRLPLKVLRLVDERHSMLELIIKRVQSVKKVDEVYLCTSDEPVDDILEDVASLNNIKVFRGSPDLVIDRMIKVGALSKADNLIRITGDDVFIAAEYLDHQITFLEDNNLDYVRLIDVPLGSSAEVMRFDALNRCYEEMDPSVSEYLTLFLFEPETYNCGVIKPFEKDYSDISLTVDLPVDLERTKAILEYFSKQPKYAISTAEIVKIIQSYNIPNSYFSAGGIVKLPYGKVISYAAFLEDMKDRESKSKSKQLF